VLIAGEENVPYDRTKLSKAYLAGKARPEAMPLRRRDFYEAQNIEWRPNTLTIGLGLKIADYPI
jgi:NAD(P)H-nitrite reductase large subunit